MQVASELLLANYWMLCAAVPTGHHRHACAGDDKRHTEVCSFKDFIWNTARVHISCCYGDWISNPLEDLSPPYSVQGLAPSLPILKV